MREHDRPPLPNFDLETFKRMMLRLGVRQLLFKELAPNDNSKNQVYLGGNLEIANLLPIGEVRSERVTSQKGTTEDRLKAPIPLFWMLPNGDIESAPDTQIILYPQYPEIRVSGFLQKTAQAPNGLMRTREAGRILFFGITTDRKIIAAVVGAATRLASDIRKLRNLLCTGVLQHVPIGTADTSRLRLLTKLRAIHRLGWIYSQRLQFDRSIVECKGTNCGGYTLEAKLGVVPNGLAEPDFEGWEIKGYAVGDFSHIVAGTLTLMTPQPTGGLYRTQGVEKFVRTYGYKDKSGRVDRLNFSSPHHFGIRNKNTGLTLQLLGFDVSSRKITDATGGFALIDDRGREAATWHFASLLQHWNRKHAKAAYVPYTARKSPRQQYHYADKIRIGEDTDFIRFLTALSEDKVFYDPGIKLEGISTPRPKAKHRSQFRITSSKLPDLYARMNIERL